MGIQLLEVLEHIHVNRLIYNNLKTSNIYVDNGTLKLVNFDTAREYLTPDGQLIKIDDTVIYRDADLIAKQY